MDTHELIIVDTPKPTIGRIVHFIYSGKHWPAIITSVWSDICVNLHVFTDGTWDQVNVPVTPTSIIEGFGEFLWHWPEKE